MNKFSLKKYGWLCVLGGEVAYFVCLVGGFIPLRSTRGIELHHALFETLPGFIWINTSSVIIGAIEVFVISWIFAWFMVWMLNSSIIKE